MVPCHMILSEKRPLTTCNGLRPVTRGNYIDTGFDFVIRSNSLLPITRSQRIGNIDWHQHCSQHSPAIRSRKPGGLVLPQDLQSRQPTLPPVHSERFLFAFALIRNRGKQQTYRSKKYDNAPMPNMQRLTWTGIAMHSGQLPGYAASHGCVRLPYDFSQLLFSTTSNGGTVVIGDGKTPVPRLASNPGLILAPTDFTPAMLHPLGKNDYD